MRIEFKRLGLLQQKMCPRDIEPFTETENGRAISKIWVSLVSEIVNPLYDEIRVVLQELSEYED